MYGTNKLTVILSEYRLNESIESYTEVLKCLAANPMIWVPMSKTVSLGDTLTFLKVENNDSISDTMEPGNKPDILVDKDGKHFLSIFSMKDEAPGWYRNNFPWKKLPFKDALRYLIGRDDWEGVIVNPFSHSLVIPSTLLSVITGRRTQSREVVTQTAINLRPVGKEADALKLAAIHFMKKRNVIKAYLARMTVNEKESYVFAVQHREPEEELFAEMRQQLFAIPMTLPVYYASYSSLKLQLLGSGCRILYLGESTGQGGANIFEHGLAWISYEQDEDGIIGGYKIHFGKPYWGYYYLFADGAVSLQAYLNSQYGTVTLEEGLLKYTYHKKLQKLKNGDQTRNLRNPNYNDILTLLDTLPDLMEELNIYYEAHMYFD